MPQTPAGSIGVSNPRSVSGEIMTGVAPMAARQWRHEPGRATMDAEFEVVSGSQRAHDPVSLERPVMPAIAAVPPAASRRAGASFWAAGIGIAILAFWLSGGHALMRDGARVAFKSEPIEIVSVKTRIETAAGRDLLLIDGEAVNRSPLTQALPGIDVAVASPTGTVTKYRIGSSQRRLSAGENYLFSSRLRVSEDGVKSVAVTLQPLD